MSGVDPGFAQGVSRHVAEDGPLLVAVSKVGDPALWDTVSPTEAVKTMMAKGTLHDARKRSLDQARALLQAGIEAVRD